VVEGRAVMRGARARRAVAREGRSIVNWVRGCGLFFTFFL
jgi:hypothetical protein